MKLFFQDTPDEVFGVSANSIEEAREILSKHSKFDASLPIEVFDPSVDFLGEDEVYNQPN